MNRTYPYKAWVLQPSGKPKEIELVEEDFSWSDHSDWDITSAGKSYNTTSEVHATKDAAITAGLAALDVQQAKLTKQQANLDKKRATLIAARSA